MQLVLTSHKSTCTPAAVVLVFRPIQKAHTLPSESVGNLYSEQHEARCETDATLHRLGPLAAGQLLNSCFYMSPLQTNTSILTDGEIGLRLFLTTREQMMSMCCMCGCNHLRSMSGQSCSAGCQHWRRHPSVHCPGDHADFDSQHYSQRGGHLCVPGQDQSGCLHRGHVA